MAPQLAGIAIQRRDDAFGRDAAAGAARDHVALPGRVAGKVHQHAGMEQRGPVLGRDDEPFVLRGRKYRRRVHDLHVWVLTSGVNAMTAHVVYTTDWKFDHTPVDDDAKLAPFAESEPGATGLELLLPLTLKWAQETKTPLSTAIEKITCAPSGVLGIDAGHLGVGSQADICIFDQARYWKIEARALKSQGKNSPFLGLELAGKVRCTMLAGHPVYQEN